jgi:hypothetical protein
MHQSSRRKGQDLPIVAGKPSVVGKCWREGNTGVRAGEWLRTRDFDPIRTPAQPQDGGWFVEDPVGAGVDSPWVL